MLMKRCAISLALSGLAGSLLGAELSSQEIEFFENKIRPILAESCYECHNSVDKKKGDLSLDYREALLESEVIVPGNPDESPLILAIRHHEDYEPMPPKSPKRPDSVGSAMVMTRNPLPSCMEHRRFACSTHRRAVLKLRRERWR